MPDPASTARIARESLSRGLQALQSDPTVPPQLLDLAAVIAQSMGALHQIERSNGTQLLPHASIALENVRKVLSQLQSVNTSHPAVNVAMESVASSLGLVHSLHQLASSPAPLATAPLAAAPPPPPPMPPVGIAPIAPLEGAPIPLTKPLSNPHQAAFSPHPGAAPQAGPGAPAFQPPPAPPYIAQQPPPGPAFPPPPQQPVFQAPPQPQHFGGGIGPGTGPGAYPYTPPPAPNPAPPGFAPSPGPAGDLHVVSADLGTHSATNFYKGLSGNDIIDHGGLFVSTYMIPKLGTQIRLKVSLPGGYEFEANGIVRWAREQSDGSDAPPGFGAQFTQITPEARQLVYRYVRNREPLFHDDL
ncbi:PilZ domain-containing protein [Pendulispora rubella]|uniref:PilZ domain-containing protein n=1 Tax=Pendulispora rubella TaxID=2741070 RepID=A0ABZ2L416_9BACT